MALVCVYLKNISNALLLTLHSQLRICNLNVCQKIAFYIDLLQWPTFNAIFAEQNKQSSRKGLAVSKEALMYQVSILIAPYHVACW